MRDRGVALAALALGTGLLLTASLARGQETVLQQPKKVFGYLDPKTGRFVPASTGPRPDTSTTGTVTLKVSIKLASTELEKSSSETITGTAVSAAIWDETATYSATISGSAATCTVSSYTANLTL